MFAGANGDLHFLSRWAAPRSSGISHVDRRGNPQKFLSGSDRPGLGIDRFMSEARALTNLIGNGVATIVVSKM